MKTLPGFGATISIALFALALTGAAQTAPQVTPAQLTVNFDQPVVKISPTLYGLMTEEINYSYDGGLYAELIRDRTFHDRSVNAFLKQWTLAQNAEDGASWELDHSTGPSASLPYSLKLTVAKASAQDPAGIENDGYWGVPAIPNATYTASFYAKSEKSGPITFSIVNNKTGRAIATASFPAPAQGWKQYKATMHLGHVAPSKDNFVRITLSHPGVVWFNLISLFPPAYEGKPNGDRIDLMEKLAAMHPAFLRFPGGNYLEGEHLSGWYDWKRTIGPLADRPTHPSPWRYQSSDGMGLLEFLDWCEALHMQPVLAVYAGYSLAHEHIDAGPKLAPYVQAALDEIEYVTGSPSSKWGAERAKDGHPQPFTLRYIEIGNEDEFDKSGSYDGRFAQFAGAIRKRYPKLQLIATAPVKSATPDVLDEHFYRSEQEFFDDTRHYDKVSRSGPKIFVGEWATIEGAPTPDFGAALSDAAWMTGLERNSDLVIMASYAPLLVNVNPLASQWPTNLIGYDALHSYGSPSYYAQTLFSRYRGNEVVSSKLEGAGPLFFYSATRDAAARKLYLKIVNASPAPQPLILHFKGDEKLASAGRLTDLSAKSTHDTNTITDPERIVPRRSEITGIGHDMRRTIPPYSIEFLEMNLQ